MVYTFDVYGSNSDQLCWTSAQEIAHAFGLEHQFLQKDPLTYLAGDLPKRFRDETRRAASTRSARASAAGQTQNTYRTIVALFGPGAPTPPRSTIKFPRDGKQGPAWLPDHRRCAATTFASSASSCSSMACSPADDRDADRGRVRADASGTDRRAEPTRSRSTRSTSRASTATARRSRSRWARRARRARAAKARTSASHGVCLPGPDEAGGLGSVCQGDTECLSHRCADAGEQLKHCVEECTPGNAGSCPSEFACIADGAAGVCWPATRQRLLRCGRCAPWLDPARPRCRSRSSFAVAVGAKLSPP